MNKDVQIAPSILSANFAKMGQELDRISDADLIHCDVMDGHFVPNITFGAKMVADLRRVTTKPLDAHLMICNPEKYLDNFIAAGADYIVIHVESTDKVAECLAKIRAAGRKCGLAISPDTPVSAFAPHIKNIDLALLMSVYPGFSGQKFIPASVERLKELAEMRRRLNPSCVLQMDGGIAESNIATLVALGLDIAVAGNAVFAAESPNLAIKNIKTAAKNG